MDFKRREVTNVADKLCNVQRSQWYNSSNLSHVDSVVINANLPTNAKRDFFFETESLTTTPYSSRIPKVKRNSFEKKKKQNKKNKKQPRTYGPL